MNVLKLGAIVATVLATLAQLSAAWVPTGATDMKRLPDLQGQNARTLELSTQMLFQEKNVMNGRITGYRWSPLSGATIQFRMNPSTGTELRDQATDGAGWSRVRWEVPRRNTKSRFSYIATYRGGFKNGVRLSSKSDLGVIYVRR
jgi:hypothetical protein